MSTRAKNGESSVYFSEADSKWHGWVTVGTKANGSPDRRHRMAATEDEVREKVRALEKMRDSGKAPKAGRPPTVEKWFTTWMDTDCARKVADGSMAPRSLDDYRSKCRLYVFPAMGKLRIDKVEPEHLDKMYLDLLNRGLASSTVLKVHRIVSRGLKVAMQRTRLFHVNPASLLDAPAVEEPEIEPLTVEETRRLLVEAGTRRNGARWAVALAQGVRQGEALGLRWEYVDLEAAEMKIWWQLQRLKWQHGCEDPHACGAKFHRKKCKATCTTHKHYKRGCPKPCPKDCDDHAKACPERTGGGLVIRAPKSRRNKRTIAIPAHLVSLLRAHKAVQNREKSAAGDLWEDNDLVFCQENGKPIDPRADWQEFKDILEAAGIRDARVHDARHTTGAMLIEAKVNPRVVMEVLGHSQMRTTERYTKVASPLVVDAADKMGGRLWG